MKFNKALIKGTLFFILFILIFIGSHQVLHADAAPKPSIVVKAENLKGRYYITLLSKEDAHGPWHKDKKEYIVEDIGLQKEIDKFFEFEDEYYNIGKYTILDDYNKTFSWTYYPPDDFKVLVYSPEKDEFYLSEPYERFSFYSYYDLKLENGVVSLINDEKMSREEVIKLKKRQFPSLMKTFMLTLSSTLVIELGLALLFGYRKKELLFIAIMNCITQLLLYAILFMIFAHRYYFSLILGESLVFSVEAIAYMFKFDRKGKAFVYSVMANILSIILGGFVILIFSI